ncbi:MAG: hypothetical protein AAB353_02310 [Candidatus Hydrogenedentota bacterium]
MARSIPDKSVAQSGTPERFAAARLRALDDSSFAPRKRNAGAIQTIVGYRDDLAVHEVRMELKLNLEKVARNVHKHLET